MFARPRTLLGDSHFSTRTRTGTAIFGSLRWHGDSDSLHSSFPIDRLLPELLANVFEWYIITVFSSLRLEADGREDIFEGARDLEDPPNPYCWLVVRHVCRAWRQISLGHPRLSSYICLMRPACVQDLLNRSGDAQLHVYMPQLVPRDSIKAYQESWELVCGHLYRSVSADLFIPGEGLRPAEARGQLPWKLEELRVLYDLSRGRDQAAEPFTLTAAPLPTLRTCALIYATFQDVSPFLVPSLRRLSVDLHHSSLLRDPATIISILCSTPNLEELVLRGIGANWYRRSTGGAAEDMVVSAPPWSLGKKATLPFLREVVLQGIAGEQHFQLLDHMEYPPLEVLNLKANAVACTPLYEQIAESIQSHIHAMPARSASIVLGKDHDGSPDFVVEIHLWSNCLGTAGSPMPSPDDSEERPVFSLSVDWTNPTFASQVVRSLRLPTVTKVHFQERGWTAASTWREALENFPSMRELQLEFTVPSWGYHRTHIPPTALWENDPKSLVTLLPNLQRVYVFVEQEEGEDRCTDFAALAYALEPHFSVEWKQLGLSTIPRLFSQLL